MRTKRWLGCVIAVGMAFPTSEVAYGDSTLDVADQSSAKAAESARRSIARENFQIHAGWKPLFNGRDLNGWYTFLQQHGRNADPDGIVAIKDGVIHLYRDTPEGSHVVMGYIATEKEYGDYHLRLEYRWGKKKFEPRGALARDAGLYYHLAGEDAVWPAGLQCQIQENDTGELLALYGLQADTWVDPASKEREKRTFQDPKLGGEPVVLGGSGIAYQSRSIMNELAGWNTLEVIARGDTIRHVLNGKTVNRAERVRKVDAADPTRTTPVTKGRIALEIEAAEIEYRNIEIKQLEAVRLEDDRAAQEAKKAPAMEASDVRVGASAVNLRSDGSMVIAGGIEPHYAAEREGELRAVAVVVERPGEAKLAIVACDVLWVPRDLADAAVAEIEQKTGIPANHVLINATHTHHAPSTAAAHAFGVVPEFREEVRRGIVRSVVEANARLDGGESRFFFHLANEDTVGSNSRQLLEDGGITWGGQQIPSDKARPTAPFDPQLPVLDFRDASGTTRALVFNHSTHTIGTRSGRDVRSPSFYGLAAQELEKELGGIVSFLEGASGSTHNVAPVVPVPECISRLKAAIHEARQHATARPVALLSGMRRPFKFRVRKFNDAEEDAKIVRYMTRYAPQSSDRVREVFANMRRQLRDQQGEERETWIQALVIGDVAIVGVPAEYFTVLGIDIKRRSPFEHTYVAELANDWVGYLPDREGHQLGGYQTWMGLHSYAEEGTGERMVDEVVQLLEQMARGTTAAKNEHRGAEEAPNGPQSPAAEQAGFRLADAELRIELVASEPEIKSPVAIAWDADGRMYVAEMGGYPESPGLGRIRRLEDRDGDGKYETATTFCDGLNFPASVMPYRGGILVADAPDILYVEDIDGDGRADIRRVEWTGFGTGSQQLRANSLHWGLDNWIYVANGRCDGDVRRPEAPPEQSTSIRGRDFRFHPIRGECQAILGQSQFGQAHDAWGNRFLSWNTVPIRHVMLEEADVRAYPAAATEAANNIAEPSDTGRVYPISAPPLQFNMEPARFYNAMCGLTIFTGDALGAAYAGNAFVCESLTNLVTRRELQRSGPTFTSRRCANETDREFLASTDGWFHPVNLATGPDGSLYVVDFYRQFVEHPLYVADAKQRATINWRNGNEYGRIWRIRHADLDPARRERRPRLSDATNEALVQMLEYPVAWWRNTAQRLLVERHDQAVVPQLRTMLAESPAAVARLHAMYVLDGLGPDKEGDPALDEASLHRALEDAEANVRRHAVRLAAARINSKVRLLSMAGDADAGVRFQLALAIGGLADPQSPRALSRLLKQDGTPQIELAILCGSGKNPWALARQLLNDGKNTGAPANFLEKLGEQIALEGSPQGLAECLAWFASDLSRSGNTDGLAVLAGLSRGLVARGSSLRDPKLPEESASEQSTLGIGRIVETARSIALDERQSVENRSRAVVIAANGEPASVDALVLELVQPGRPQAVQTAAIWAAAQANSTGVWRTLFDQWPAHALLTRGALIEQALRCTAGSDALVRALETNILTAQELPTSTRGALGSLQDESLRQRVQPMLAAIAPANREEIVARYAEGARRRGDAARGASVFQRNCQTCHAMQGVGHKVGPDLSSVASRRSDLLIADILDPSQQVSPDYVNYLVVTTDGRVLNGLIAGETTDSVTLRREEGRQDTIRRNEIEELRATGKSIMPDGLEGLITPEQLADLLEFLREPDVALLAD